MSMCQSLRLFPVQFAAINVAKNVDTNMLEEKFKATSPL